MAVASLAREVSDLCLGKPPLRSISFSTSVADTLSFLKRFGDSHLSVWTCDHNNLCYNSKSDVDECRCIGKICMVDVVCFLSKEDSLKNPGFALQQPVFSLLPNVPGIVRHLEPHASLMEAMDLVLEGAQNLVIPLHNPFTRKKLTHKSSSNSTLHNNREYCWLTQEDIIRYLLNSIGIFSPIPNHTIQSLNLIDSDSILAVHYDDPATSALPLISQSLIKQTSVAIVDNDGKLIGEISPVNLNYCDHNVIAAIATLTAGDLMTFIECGETPEEMIRVMKERLEERKYEGVLELIEDEMGISSSSSDEEYGLGKNGGNNNNQVRVVTCTDAIVCYPWSSLIAVMIQALSHRVSYVWVVGEDGSLVGLVTFAGMLRVFRERLKLMV